MALRGPAGRAWSTRWWTSTSERRDVLMRRALGAPGEGAVEDREAGLGTMFVWAPIPEPFAEPRIPGVLEAPHAPRPERGRVARASASASSGEGYVRFALVENNHRIRQAVRGIRQLPARERARVVMSEAVGVGTDRLRVPSARASCEGPRSATRDVIAAAPGVPASPGAHRRPRSPRPIAASISATCASTPIQRGRCWRIPTFRWWWSSSAGTTCRAGGSRWALGREAASTW